MNKLSKIIFIVLTLVFVLSGCENTPKSTSPAPTTLFKKSSFEKIEKIKEQKIKEIDYKEFVSLFNDFSGFDFEKYFFIPEEGEYSSWEVSEEAFWLRSVYILPQNNAEELLKILRKNNDLLAYYNFDDLVNCRIKTPLSESRKNKTKCYCFFRNLFYKDINVERNLTIEILPTGNANNTYSVYLMVTIGRERTSIGVQPDKIRS